MTTTTLTLAAFLEQRLAEDEVAARNHGRYDDELALIMGDRHRMSQLTADAILRTVREHDWSRHDPARVLAEIAAKRAIVELHTPVREWASLTGQGCRTCVDVGEEYALDEDGDERLVDTFRHFDWPCATLRALASVYADHPDFREEWAS